MKPYRGFADRIRARRKELDLTLGQIAEMTGWSVPYVSEIERGVKQPPPVENLKRLAKALQLDYFELGTEAELSRRSVEIDLEGAGRTQRHVALFLARRIEEGLTEEQAQRVLDFLMEDRGPDDDEEYS